MRILQINKFFYRRGGAEVYCINLIDLLQKHGHEVAIFSMKDARNLPTPYERYFIENVDFEQSDGILKQIKKAFHVWYSFQAVRRLERLIRDFQPDIAHLHNIYHHLSPSILRVLRKHHIPTVMTLHDYKLICPAYRLYDGRQICERCKPDKYLECVKNRCLKGSRLGSLVVALEAYKERILRTYQRSVDLYISPSRFLAQKFSEWGWKNPIHILPNFIEFDTYAPTVPQAQERFVLFVGRLSDEKGFNTLLQAAQRLPQIPFVVVGEGPLDETLRQQASANVTFLGRLEKTQVKHYLQTASMLVVPSTWYENNPLIVMEAMATGLPVVASEIGGIPELVHHEETGLLFRMGDAQKCAQQILMLWNDPLLCQRLGKNARHLAEEHLGSEAHYHALMRLYESARERKKKRK